MTYLIGLDHYVLLALSLVTLRHYVHVPPLWVALALSGALLIALALAVERALRRAPAGERRRGSVLAGEGRLRQAGVER